MLLKICHNTRYSKGKSVLMSTFAAAFLATILCFILRIREASSLPRVDNNWSHRRPNATVAQSQWGQPGYRPAGGLTQQQPFVYNRNNQTLGKQQWPLNNNHNTQYQQTISPLPTRSNQTHSNWNQSNYPGYQLGTKGVFNQTRVSWSQQPSQPIYGSGSFNQSRPVWSQNPPAYPSYGSGSFNQSRPAGSQPSASYIPQNPAYGQSFHNQSRPAWPQNSPYGQASLNQSHPTWPQPSAPLLPNNPQNPSTSASNLYPQLPNNPNSKPVVPLNSWTPSANHTLLYPQLPNQNIPTSNNNGIPLAPLQPQPNPQGPHNWHSGGQSALSYGPGNYPPPADNSNKTPPNRQGSSNPYANIFI